MSASASRPLPSLQFVDVVDWCQVWSAAGVNGV